MKVTGNGIVFDDYSYANPSQGYSVFTDADGARLYIKTTTLIKMYELVKFDMERRGEWDFIMKSLG